MDNFNTRLTHKMSEMHLTQEDLASKLDVSQSTISRWMTNSKPRKITAHQLASILETTTDWLLNGGEEKEPVNLKAIKELRELEEPYEINRKTHNENLTQLDYKTEIQLLLKNMSIKELSAQIHALLDDAEKGNHSAAHLARIAFNTLLEKNKTKR